MTTVQATEDNMNIVRSLIQQGFDAMAEASKLAEAVAQLKKDVEELRQTMDYLRSRNSELDNLLTDVRKQRDDAIRDSNHQKEENSRIERERQTLANDRDYLQRQLTEAQASIEALKKENDDRAIRILELEENLEEAQTKLQGVEEAAVRVFGLMRPPKEVPQLEAPTAPTPEQVEATPTQEAQPAPAADDRPWWQKNQSAAS